MIDLPYCGRSSLVRNGVTAQPLSGSVLDTLVVEKDQTAPSKQTQTGWQDAEMHSQWPGVGAWLGPRPEEQD